MRQDCQVKIYRIAVYSCIVDDAPKIAVLQLPKFKAEATELIGTGGIEAVAAYLIIAAHLKGVQ